MRCNQRNCENVIEPSERNPFKKYCTPYCSRREAQLSRNDKALLKLKEKYSKTEDDNVENDKDCKYCKNADHKDFCSLQHRKIYEETMAPINIALGR